MEIKTTPIFRSQTPRVKCIVGHPSYPDIVVCLYTGEISIFDPKTCIIKKTNQVCDVAIRTAAIVPSKDWILVGNDEGKILVIDLGKLIVIDSLKVHDDFVRKIIVDEANSRFVTVSDDNRSKLWSYNNGFQMINKYKDAKHFVMDAVFCPNDSSHFLTVCLDKKIRLYSVTNNKMIKQYKGHEGGVNSIAFINQDTFVTASDDCTVMVWDMKRTQPVAVLKGHSRIVNSIAAIKNGFASCSEDNTVRIWSNELKLVEILTFQNRVWSSYMKQGRIIVGTDDELAVFEECSSHTVAQLCDNKIYYNIGNTVNCIKCDDIGAFKELGSIENDFESFKLSPNGKTIAVMGNNRITVSSTLGLRKKYSDVGNDLFFIDNDKFIYLNDQTVILVNKTEVEANHEINGINKILYADKEFIIVTQGTNTVVYAHNNNLEKLHTFKISSRLAQVQKNYFILADEQISIYDQMGGQVDTIDLKAEVMFVHENVLYVGSAKKSYYVMMHQIKAYLFTLKACTNMVGIKDNKVFYLSNGVKSDTIDVEFIAFQRDYLAGQEPTVQDTFQEKAIAFFELIGLYEKALSLATDENQKFEILIKLGRHEEALQSANSPIKFGKLGNKFLALGQLSKAADCYFKSNDLDTLFLVDLYGERKYLDFVAKTAKECGKNNLALLAAYKNEDYEMCKQLLKNTPFGNAFSKFYCQ